MTKHPTCGMTTKLSFRVFIETKGMSVVLTLALESPPPLFDGLRESCSM